jgi:hypothetical protein
VVASILQEHLSMTEAIAPEPESVETVETEVELKTEPGSVSIPGSVPTFAIGSGGVILLVVDDYNFTRRQRYRAKTIWQCYTKVCWVFLNEL